MATNLQAVMPLDDYIAACDAIRAQTGSQSNIVSGDLATLISGIANPLEWYGTQAEYDALPSYAANTFYYITD